MLKLSPYATIVGMLDLKHIDTIKAICKEAGMDYLALFGSYARGDHTELSDIDLLVNNKEVPSLLTEAGTLIKLEDTLGKKVDLVSERCLKDRMKPYVMEDLKVIYDER